MGSNGQQLSIFVPNGTTKVQVAGTNQNNAHVTWHGSAEGPWPYNPNPQQVYIAATLDWWWKGVCEVWFDDNTGKTHYFKTKPIPVSYDDDKIFVTAPGVDPTPLATALGGTGHILGH